MWKAEGKWAAEPNTYAPPPRSFSLFLAESSLVNK